MNEQETENRFEQWAVVEMLGHRRIVGHVSEQVIAGVCFIRVDVPGIDGSIAQTQFVSPGAIYAITPVSEEAARVSARRQVYEPVTVWDLPEQVRLAIAKTSSSDDEADDESVLF